MPPPFPPPFEITTAAADGAVLVTVSGELDMATAPQLTTVLAEQSAKGGVVVLDMTGLEFIDSTGIAVVVRAVHESRRDGFDLRLTPAGNDVMRAFELCDLLESLPFVGRA